MDDITKADVRRAMQILGDIPELEKQLQTNRACGIDCDELDARCKWAKNILTNFVEIHGPIL